MTPEEDPSQVLDNLGTGDRPFPVWAFVHTYS